MAASSAVSSWPPSGITNAVALRRSGLTSTAVTVIEASAQVGIAHVAALEQLGQQMAHLLADAQLALAGRAVFHGRKSDAGTWRFLLILPLRTRRCRERREGS